MNQKEINELRRRWRPDRNAVSRVYGCYVSPAREIVSDIEEPLSLMDEDEREKYLGLLKKALSGAPGKNLIDIVFSTAQVADSDEHRLLMGLRESRLKDPELRRLFYERVLRSLDLEDSGYLLLMAADDYDVPYQGKDGGFQDGAGDQVFSYFLCCVCPVKETRPALRYFSGDNEFHFTAGQTVGAPELGFLFPCFDDRTANLYNALFYSRRPDQIHQEFIDAVFHVDPPMSSAEQREAFEGALRDALADSCDLNVAQAIHERLSAKIAEHRESRDPEPLGMTAKEIGAILRDCRVPEEHIEAFQKNCGERFGAGAVLSPANLIDPGRFVVQTERATVAVDPEYSFEVETRMIGGKPYLLIPAGTDVEVNGMAVKAGGQG